MSQIKRLAKWSYQASDGYRKHVAASYVLFPTGIVLSQMIAPLIIGEIFNRLSDTATPVSTYAFLIIAYYLSFGVLPEFFFRTGMYFFNRGHSGLMRNASKLAFDNIIERDESFHANNFGGSLVAKTNRFARAMGVLNGTMMFTVIPGLLALGFSLTYFLIKFPIFAVAYIVFGIVFLRISIALVKRRTPLSKERARNDSLMTAAIADAVTNSSAVRANAAESDEQKRFQAAASRLHQAQVTSNDYQSSRVDLFNGLGTSTLNIVAVSGAVYAVTQGFSEVGVMFVAMSYVQNLSRRLWEFSRMMSDVEVAMSDASEMIDILEQPLQVQDTPGAKKLKVGSGEIIFDNVTYAYSDAPKGSTLFSNLNLTIPAGQKVGLVGASGGGKTTITRILLRFSDIQAGKITIDNQDISQVTKKSLRGNIAYVPQEPLLFHRTLAENIAYSRPKATKAQIIAAAKKAHAHDFIMELPQQYETLVGERGIKLSGGQRQRVVIARAILKDAPILVLDEATSALDSESEALIQDALFKLMQGRTSIVVAHRLSTIQKMDKIVVLNKGKIIEQGSHRRLLKNKQSTYAKLWKHQSGGFLED